MTTKWHQQMMPKKNIFKMTRNKEAYEDKNLLFVKNSKGRKSSKNCYWPNKNLKKNLSLEIRLVLSG